MSKSKIVHDKIVLERRFPVPPTRVFAAWSDPTARDRWDVPGNAWAVAESQHDFRIGGREYSHFGPPGKPAYRAEGIYLQIVPNRLIVMAGTMSDGSAPITASLSTVEFLADGVGTLMTYSEQSVFMGDETAQMRVAGWTEIFDRLEAELAT